MLLKEFRCPHPTVLVVETLFFKHSFTRKMGEPLMAKAGVHQEKNALYNLEQLCKWWREALEIQIFSKTSQEYHIPRHWMHQCSWYLLCRRQKQSKTLLFLLQKMNESLISPDLQRRKLNFLKPCPTVMRIRSNKSYPYLMCSWGTKLSNSTNINTTRQSCCSFFSVTF